jgi:hypothetical protein
LWGKKLRSTAMNYHSILLNNLTSYGSPLISLEVAFPVGNVRNDYKKINTLL